MSLRLDDGSQRVSVSFDIAEESLGRAEVEVHIQTDRQMVQVVGDIESNDFFFFIFFGVFHQ